MRAGIHTSVTCRNAGTPTNSHSHARSRPATRRFGRGRRATVVSSSARSAHSNVYVDFCSSTVPRIESILLGSAMKSARATPTTLAAKSGSVSRSRNCAMYVAELTSSTDRCWSALYALVSAPRGGDHGRVHGDVGVDRSRRAEAGSSALAPSSLSGWPPS